MADRAEAFLAEWRERDPRGLQRYQDLCAENGNTEEFRANPLAFIVANKPLCCLMRALEYVSQHRVA